MYSDIKTELSQTFLLQPRLILIRYDPLLRMDLLLHGAVYFAGSETTCANFRSSDSAVFFDSDSLNVRVPLSSRMSV